MLVQPLPEPAPSSAVVEKSVTGKRWVMEEYNERLALTLSQRHTLPDIVAQIMAARDISPEEAADFLDPTLRALMPDPAHLKDMPKAAARFAKAIAAKEKICVYGDYDVDGATSSALLMRFGRACGHSVEAYVPDRIKEGYGPNEAAMKALAARGFTLIVTVDCGTAAHQPLAAAKEAGVDVIVLDHHIGEPELPPAFAVVNPNRFDESSEQRHLAAVGVTFLFLVAVHKQLKADGFFENRTVPNLLDELDLVALGTVCDMVALKGANRAFVRQGLRILSTTNNIGLRALLNSSRQKGPMDCGTAGFLLGPRVNAGGRVGKSDLGARLLSSESEVEAEQLAAALEKLNEERRAIEKDIVEQAFTLVPHEVASCVMVEAEGWHPGVIGLVASRLKERFNRPSFATAFDDKGVGKGSCRSVRGIDIGALVIAAKQEGLLTNGGGHAMAAGYTVGHNRYPEFKAFVEVRTAKMIEEAPLEPTLVIDGILAVPGATLDLAGKILALAPFGMGNPEPRFAVMDAVLMKAEVMSEKHLRLSLTDRQGAYLRAVCWRAMDNHIGPALMGLARGARLHVAGHLQINHWNNRTDPQFVVEDVKTCG
ncbi:MAG: single-stranded-DNA-specific exonuclease RecJ [Proteobacteria bacterium]|nr:single-stranded-DNA-specific exonuclease RecJ [Pseudomonadota bacterium]